MNGVGSRPLCERCFTVPVRLSHHALGVGTKLNRHTRYRFTVLIGHQYRITGVICESNSGKGS